jgi:folate-binding protein YgfZ
MGRMMETLALKDIHEATGAVFGERGGRQVVLHHGDPEAEYRAAREAVALVDLSHRDALCVTGEDRVSFFHGMNTQDIKGLAPWQSAYATMVTVKGAMVADGRVLVRDEDVLVDLEPGTFEAVRAFLDRHLISEDAELHDAHEGVAVLGLVGLRARALAEAALASWDGPRVAQLASLLSRDGVDLLVPRDALGTLHARLVEEGAPLGLRPAGLESLETVRVEDGLPRFGQDLLETTIPLEADLTHAISYNKGCYVGQEVIARATYRGQMNKKLVGLLFGNGAPTSGVDLRVEGKKVGFVTSLVRSPALGQVVGLGYVHRAHLTPGTRVTVGDGPDVAVVSALPLKQPGGPGEAAPPS